MNRVVNFPLPPSFTPDEKHYFGRQTIGSAFVVRLNPAKVACILKDYVIKGDEIIFILEVLDPELEPLLDSGEFDSNYVWFNPLESFLTLPM